MLVCDCCRLEKTSTRSRSLPPKAGTVGGQRHDPTERVPSRVYNLCDDCMADMPDRSSRARRWLEEKLG
jgi:hypothetical protein